MSDSDGESICVLIEVSECSDIEEENKNVLEKLKHIVNLRNDEELVDIKITNVEEKVEVKEKRKRGRPRKVKQEENKELKVERKQVENKEPKVEVKEKRKRGRPRKVEIK